jgi:hypothetical protein
LQQHLVHVLQLLQLVRRLHDGHATTYAACGRSPASRNHSCLTTRHEDEGAGLLDAYLDARCRFADEEARKSMVALSR